MSKKKHLKKGAVIFLIIIVVIIGIFVLDSLFFSSTISGKVAANLEIGEDGGFFAFLKKLLGL